MTARWYVATTKPGLEKVASENLRRQSFDEFLPIARLRPGESPRIVFRNYIFVAFDVDRDPWRSVNGTRGVQKLMPLLCERPLPLPYGCVEYLQERTSTGKFYDKDLDELAARFAAGDSVVMTSGLLAGHQAAVEWHRGDVVKLKTLVFGREVDVTLKADQLSRVPTHD